MRPSKEFGNALFEYDENELSQVVEEFYPAAADEIPDNSSIVLRLRQGIDSTCSAFG